MARIKHIWLFLKLLWRNIKKSYSDYRLFSKTTKTIEEKTTSITQPSGSGILTRGYVLTTGGKGNYPNLTKEEIEQMKKIMKKWIDSFEKFDIIEPEEKIQNDILPYPKG